MKRQRVFAQLQYATTLKPLIHLKWLKCWNLKWLVKPESFLQERVLSTEPCISRGSLLYFNSVDKRYVTQDPIDSFQIYFQIIVQYRSRLYDIYYIFMVFHTDNEPSYIFFSLNSMIYKCWSVFQGNLSILIEENSKFFPLALRFCS